MTRRRLALSAAALLAAAALAGCGGGQKRYSLSGSVTVGGRPVPAGEVVFEPDWTKGNNGPGSVARIKDGRYQTEPHLGVVGGPYVVRITPLSGTPEGEHLEGKPLLPKPHVESVELPAADGTHDFIIPTPPDKPAK